MTCKSLKLAMLAVVTGSMFMVQAPGTGTAGAKYGRVTAQSNYGNGSVTGAVRRRGNTYLVQLPSGFWEDCEGDCREALRRQHLDFWETINEESPERR